MFLIEAAIAKAKGSKKVSFNVGDKVIFGRPNGRKHHGFIIKKNPAKAVVQVYDNSTKNVNNWRVPYSLMKAVA